MVHLADHDVVSRMGHIVRKLLVRRRLERALQSKASCLRQVRFAHVHLEQARHLEHDVVSETSQNPLEQVVCWNHDIDVVEKQHRPTLHQLDQTQIAIQQIGLKPVALDQFALEQGASEHVVRFELDAVLELDLVPAGLAESSPYVIAAVPNQCQECLFGS